MANMRCAWKGQNICFKLVESIWLRMPNQTLKQNPHLGCTAHPPLCVTTGVRPAYTLTLDLFSNVVSPQIDRNIKHKSSCFKTPRFINRNSPEWSCHDNNGIRDACSKKEMLSGGIVLNQSLKYLWNLWKRTTLLSRFSFCQSSWSSTFHQQQSTSVLKCLASSDSYSTRKAAAIQLLLNITLALFTSCLSSNIYSFTLLIFPRRKEGRQRMWRAMILENYEWKVSNILSGSFVCFNKGSTHLLWDYLGICPNMGVVGSSQSQNICLG